MEYKALVVDDSGLMQKILTTLLVEEYGFKIIEKASNAAEAIEKLSRLKPNLVLLDISMPGQSGLTVISEAKKLKSSAKFIVVSALSDYKEDAIKLGAEDFISKPFTKDRLVKAIKKALGL